MIDSVAKLRIIKRRQWYNTGRRGGIMQRKPESVPLIHLLISMILIAIASGGQGLCHQDEQHESSIVQGALFPRLSGSGDQIVYSYLGAIWRSSWKDGTMEQLTAGEGFDLYPVWSPDETSIAFIRGGMSFSGPLRMIRSSDGSTLSIPRVSARDKLFFDSDGSRLLGTFRKEEGEFQLSWLDLETGELGDPLHPDRSNLRYALSPNAQRIVLATSLDIPDEQGGNFGPQCDLWVMPASGGTPRKVVRFPGRIYEVEWSHDGKAVFVVTNVGGAHNDVWRVPLDDPDRGAVKLTFGQADEDSPSISRDGRWFLFTENSRGPTRLVLRNQLSRQESVVTEKKIKFQQRAGRLSLHISDESGPVTARVSIRHETGNYYAPPGALYRLLRGDLHFYCEGRTEFALPSGSYQLKVTRGPEYEVLRKKFQVNPERQSSLEVKLQRWTHQRERGWFSGENHIHANYGYGQWYNSPRTMLAQGAGEDLLVCNFMVANSEADGVFDREYFRGKPDPLSTRNTVLYWNEEFRSTIWGHLNLLNLKHLIEPIFSGFLWTTHPHDHPTNVDIGRLTHDQGGHVNYTHPAHNVKDPYLSAYSAKALPLDVALGTVDSVDVMGSSHEATVPLWYRLLNCGFQLPASAGTDCFLNRVRSKLPGQDRVYVQIDGEFSYQRWIDRLRDGNTFVTNGPMFDLTVSGKGPGQQIELDQPEEAHVKGRVRSQHPLTQAELIYNGRIVSTIPVSASSEEIVVDERIPVSESGWIALRAFGEDHPDQPYGSVFGHTSPVYVKVEGHPASANRDAAYFLRWIDRLHGDVQQRDRIPSRHIDHVEAQIAKARAVYTQLAEGAN